MFSDWTDPEAVFRILQKTTAGRPCDITGIDGYDMIRSRGGIQWPCEPTPSNRTTPLRDGQPLVPSWLSLLPAGGRAQWY